MRIDGHCRIEVDENEQLMIVQEPAVEAGPIPGIT